MKKYLFLIAFFLPIVSNAATLRFDPLEKVAGSGDVFVANIRIDVAEDECVNAVSAVISYPTNILRLNTISKGESIFTLWIDEEVDHTAGKVSFTNGIPAGYCGRASGDPGNTNIVGKLVFQYIANPGSPDAVVQFLPETEVILNDGYGTKANLDVKNLTVKYGAGNGLKNEWLTVVGEDTFSPEPFTPQIIQDTSLPEKPYILIFDTIDKQSGIEHYEVVEEDPTSFGFKFGTKIKAKMSIATSPYLLQDQTLSSRIVVRAYDHAGNYEESILPPKNLPPFFDPYSLEDYVLPIIIIVTCAIIIFFIVRRQKRNKMGSLTDINSEEENFETK